MAPGYPDWQPPGYLGAKHLPGTGYPDWQPPGIVSVPAGGVVRLEQTFIEADWTEEYSFPFLQPEVELVEGGGIRWTKAQAGTVAGILKLETGKWLGSFQTVEHTFTSEASAAGTFVGSFVHYFDTTHYIRFVNEAVSSEGVVKNFQVIREQSGAKSNEVGKAVGGTWLEGNPKRWQRSAMMPGYTERSLWSCDPELPANAGNPSVQIEVGGNLAQGGGSHVKPTQNKSELGVAGAGMYAGYAGSVGWVVINPPAGFTIHTYKATSMGLLP